jgi:hypothetical protein
LEAEACSVTRNGVIISCKINTQIADRWDIEEMRNDKRVMAQYHPDYFDFLEWIK